MKGYDIRVMSVNMQRLQLVVLNFTKKSSMKVYDIHVMFANLQQQLFIILNTTKKQA